MLTLQAAGLPARPANAQMGWPADTAGVLRKAGAAERPAATALAAGSLQLQG